MKHKTRKNPSLIKQQLFTMRAMGEISATELVEAISAIGKTPGWLDMLVYRLFYWRWKSIMADNVEMVRMFRDYMAQWIESKEAAIEREAEGFTVEYRDGTVEEYKESAE